MALLEVRDLTIRFGAHPVVAGLSFDLDAGTRLGLVGESGSGKSATALALMGLLDAPAAVNARTLRFAGQDLTALAPRARRALLGRDLAMIFQDPLASLDPCQTLGAQLIEALGVHRREHRRALRARALELLAQVELPDPARAFGAYPHQLSGGMAQRGMIAMAIAGPPRLLIADEPTTALDVTVQAQILALLRRLQSTHAMALLLITHDLAVAAQHTEHLIVLYAGSVMETGPTRALLQAPCHPYTRALLDADPALNRGRTRLANLPGSVPPPAARGTACLFAARCPRAQAICQRETPPPSARGERTVRCFFPLEPAP